MNGYDRAQAAYDASTPADPQPCEAGDHSYHLGTVYMSAEDIPNGVLLVDCLECEHVTAFQIDAELIRDREIQE